MLNKNSSKIFLVDPCIQVWLKWQIPVLVCFIRNIHPCPFYSPYLRLPLGDSTAIFFCSPLFTMALSYLLLRYLPVFLSPATNFILGNTVASFAWLCQSPWCLGCCNPSLSDPCFPCFPAYSSCFQLLPPAPAPSSCSQLLLPMSAQVLLVTHPPAIFSPSSHSNSSGSSHHKYISFTHPPSDFRGRPYFLD